MKNKKKIYDIIGFSILAVTILTYIVAGIPKYFGPSQGMDIDDLFMIILPLLIAEVEVYVGVRYLRFENNRDYSKAHNVRKNIIGGMMISGSILVGVLNRSIPFPSIGGVWIFIDRIWIFVVSCVLIWFAFRHLGSAISMCVNQSGQNAAGKARETAIKVMAIIGAVLLLVMAILHARIIAVFIFGMWLK